MVPTFFLITLLLIAWIYYQRAHTDHIRKSKEEAFWEKENRANTMRKKDISSLNYIQVPLENLPFPETDDEELSETQEKLRFLATQKIVNFTGITNTDLKLAYGAPNITLLTEFDQNYMELVRTLYKYGRLLYQAGRIADAKTVLEYGLTVCTDVSANYTLLAEIYKEENEASRIDFVIEQAEKLNSMTKNALLSSLMAIRNSAIGEEKRINQP